MEENECFETAREFFPQDNNLRIPYSMMNRCSIDNNTMNNGEPVHDMSRLPENFFCNRNIRYNRGEPLLDTVSFYQNNDDSEKIYDDYKLLQDQFKAKCIALQEIQKQKMLLKEENQKLVAELANEKKKAAYINKKIKFIQQNQNVLLKLKDEYKSLKDIQLTKSHSQIDKEMQTFIVEESKIACSDENTFLVKESDLEVIQDTVQLLKQKIMNKLWTNNNGNESIFQEEMAIMRYENQSLKSNLISKTDENEKLKNDIKQKTYTIEKGRKDKNILKKIILKLEKRQRDFVKKYQIKDKESSRLMINETERNIVQNIVKRYLIKKTTCIKYQENKRNASQTSTSNELSSVPTSNYVTSSTNTERGDTT